MSKSKSTQNNRDSNDHTIAPAVLARLRCCSNQIPTRHERRRLCRDIDKPQSMLCDAFMRKFCTDTDNYNAYPELCSCLFTKSENKGATFVQGVLRGILGSRTNVDNQPLPQCTDAVCSHFGYKTSEMLKHPCPPQIDVQSTTSSKIQSIILTVTLAGSALAAVGAFIYNRVKKKQKTNSTIVLDNLGKNKWLKKLSGGTTTQT